MALAGRSPVAVDQSRRPAGQHRGQLARIPDRRRAADDDRPRAVVGADPEQPPQDVGDVTAEHAPIRVQLVDDDDLELLEELEPLGVVGEDRRVEHVRVGDHDLAGGPDGRADRGGRVPVVGRGEDRQAGCCSQAAELGHLVLPERLGREQEERPRRRIVDDRLEDRDGVAEGLARGGRGRRSRRRRRRGPPPSPRPGGGTGVRCRARRAPRRCAGRARPGNRRRPPRAAAGRRGGRRRARATAPPAGHPGRGRVRRGRRYACGLPQENEQMFETARV